MAEAINAWIVCLFGTGYMFPMIMKVYSRYKNPLWLYIPSSLMWVSFVRLHPTFYAGLAACVGFFVGVWMWREGERIEKGKSKDV